MTVRYLEPQPSTIEISCCHLERRAAKGEAKRQTQSKDPGANPSGEGNFRIVIRFFDERDTEQLPQPDRDAAVCDSPAGKCRGKEGRNRVP